MHTVDKVLFGLWGMTMIVWAILLASGNFPESILVVGIGTLFPLVVVFRNI